jgi:MOSC domain-containing protein YiiM
MAGDMERATSGGTVVSIHIAEKAGGPMKEVDNVRAVLGRGLEGDRYFSHNGTYSETPGSGRDITLIEIEQIEGIEREHGIRLGPGASRRNITTRGISLNELVDKELSIGDVIVRGTRLCEPCAYLADVIAIPGVLKALVHRAGLRCEIVSAGTIHVGDSITAR